MCERLTVSGLLEQNIRIQLQFMSALLEHSHQRHQFYLFCWGMYIRPLLQHIALEEVKGRPGEH